MLSKFRIKKSEKVLEENSVNASIFKIVPEGVFVPKDKKELISFVREILNLKKIIVQSKREIGEFLSITPRAAGTCMSGGSIGEGYIISLTENINKIISFDKIKKEAIVEPGMYFRDFDKVIAREGLMLPSYPASRELCAIGGMIANNAAGEKTLKYGKTIDYVKEVSMICSDGNEYHFKKLSGDELDDVLRNDLTFYGDIHRKVLKLIKENKYEIRNNKPVVSKNSSGYCLWDVYDEVSHSMDITKLLVGSQGTLGVITSSKVSLVNSVSYSKMAVIFLESLQDMPSLVNKVLEIGPESFEVFDDHTFKIAMKFLPQIIKRIGGNIFSLIKLFWPEFKILLSGNIPKIVMLVEFCEKDSQDLNLKVKLVNKLFEELKENKRIKTHIVKNKQEAKKYWIFRRESFNLLRSKLKDVRTVPFIEDVVVGHDDLAEFLPEFEKILDEENLVYTIAGHVGDGNIHVIPLMKLSDQKSIDKIEKISKKVYALVKKYRGSLSGEHNDGLIRTPFLDYMFSDKMIKLFENVKEIFDPLNVFNPNKKVGVTLEYMRSKIDRSI